MLGRQFLHGTAHWFKPGEKVDPTPSMYHTESQAWATRDAPTAARVATARSNPNEWTHVKKDGPTQLSMFSPVFEVSGKSELKPSMEWQSKKESKNFVDSKGLKVEKLHGYANNLKPGEYL